MKTEYEGLLQAYTIDVREPVPEGLTREVFFTIKSQFKGDIQKIVEAYKLGNTPNIAKLYYHFGKKAVQVWLFSPRAFDIKSDYLVLRCPNGYKLYVAKSKLTDMTPDDIAQICHNYILAQVRVEQSRAYALKLQVLRAKEDVESAKRICSKIPPIVALTYGMGWKVTPDLVRLNLVRFSANIKLFGDGIIPIIQLTARGTGKTTHGVWCSEVLGYGYVSKIPTIARLILDARTGQFGLVYKSGVIFDEFTDLSALDRARAQQIVDVIKTGLSHGLWTRETATPKGVSPTLQKYLPFIWYGNCDITPHDAREYITHWLKREAGIQGAEAFVDRFALIDITYNIRPEVAGLLTFKILRASVMRGILAYVKQMAEQKPLDKYMNESRLDGRQKIYSARVRAVFEALLSTDEEEVEFEQKEIDAIVRSNDWGETYDFIKEVTETYA